MARLRSPGHRRSQGIPKGQGAAHLGCRRARKHADDRAETRPRAISRPESRCRSSAPCRSGRRSTRAGCGRSPPPGPTTCLVHARSSKSYSVETRTTGDHVRTGSKRSSTRSASPRRERSRRSKPGKLTTPQTASRPRTPRGSTPVRPGSAAARRESSVTSPSRLLGVAYLALNTRRPLFANVNLRKAVNYAIDRPALARQNQSDVLRGRRADRPVSPPGDAWLQRPPHLSPRRARRRDGETPCRRQGGRAVLYTCNIAPCPQQAQIVRANLKAIGIDVEIRAFPYGVPRRQGEHEGRAVRHRPSGLDMDYADPYNLLNNLIDGTGIKARTTATWPTSTTRPTTGSSKPPRP